VSAGGQQGTWRTDVTVSRFSRTSSRMDGSSSRPAYWSQRKWSKNRALCRQCLRRVVGSPLGAAVGVEPFVAEAIRRNPLIEPWLCRLWSEKLPQTRAGTSMSSIRRLRLAHQAPKSGCSRLPRRHHKILGLVSLGT
jgi:hypothetical protein